MIAGASRRCCVAPSRPCPAASGRCASAPRRRRCCGPSRRRRPVEGRDRPPVEVPGQPAGVEEGALVIDGAAVVVGLDAQLQPGLAGHPHLGPQPQQLVRARSPRPARSPAPRRRRARRGSRRPRRSPTPPTSRSSSPRTVQPSGKEYQPRVAADAVDHSPEVLRAGVDDRWSARRCRASRRPSPGRSAAGRSARPATRAFDQRVSTSASRIWPVPARGPGRSRPGRPAGRGHSRAMSCSWQTTSLDRLCTSGRAIAARHRRDDVDPERGQSRRQQRHRHDQPPPQPGHRRVALHHLLVRQDVRAADVEGAADLGRQLGAADQVAQHVADRDRLDPAAHPARGRPSPAAARSGSAASRTMPTPSR